MERQLYPGIAFSPQTTLTENIGEADTIIKISDASAFPEAPNLATIGIDEDGETILYTAKTEDALSGCQRGVEGTAKAWKAGEIIGRNFTAKDHNDLIAAVGETGEAATTAQDAAAAAQSTAENANKTADVAVKGVEDIQQRISRPNLLDNPDFTINQRGVSGTISTPGYFLDRWKLTSGSVTISSGGITLNGTIQQILETAPSGTLTASYLTNSGVQKASYDSASKTFSITASNTLIKAAKLELGSVQTLAHQEDGKWVLNDPPPNKALELAKCQRYQVKLGGEIATRQVVGFFIQRTSTRCSIYVPIPTFMRSVNGTISFVGEARIVYNAPGETGNKTMTVSSATVGTISSESGTNMMRIEFDNSGPAVASIGCIDVYGLTNYMIIDKNL